MNQQASKNELTDEEVDAHIDAHLAAMDARAAGLDDVTAKPLNRAERRKHQKGGRQSPADQRMWASFGAYADRHGGSYR